ncbi:hypothetical protein Tco_1515574 [Tanacetum coccineum]
MTLGLLRTLLVQNLAAIDDLKEMVKDELEGVCGGEVAAGSLEPKGGDACFRDELDNVFEEEDGGWIYFLGGNNSSGTKKYRGSNSSDGGNTRDGVKITGGVIESGGGIGLLRTLLDQNLAAIDDLEEMVKDELEGVCGGEVAAGSLEPKGGDVADFRAMRPTPLKHHLADATTQDSKDSLEGTNRNEGDQELSVLCTNLSNRVLALESIKDAQATKISALKSRIKKLEKKCKHDLHLHGMVKGGRKKSKPESTLDDSIVFDDQDADHDMEYMKTEEAMDKGRQSGETEEVKLTDDTKVVEDKGSGDKGGNAEELVSTARPEVSTARPDIDATRQEDSAVEPRSLYKQQVI